MRDKSLGTLIYEKAGTLTGKNTGFLIVHIPGTLIHHNTGKIILLYFATRFHFFLRGDNSQLTVEVLSRQDHTFRYDTFQFTWSQVCNKTNLFTYQVFRSIMLGNT